MGVILRAFARADRANAVAALRDCRAFSAEEVRVATEMIDAGLDGEYRLVAAELDGVFAGYLCMGEAPLTLSSWYLYWICVSPDLQRRGLGEALQGSADAAARDRGGGRIVVETSGRPGYAPSRAFYERLGYAQVGRIPDFYQPGDDCVVYCKTIPAEETP